MSSKNEVSEWVYGTRFLDKIVYWGSIIGLRVVGLVWWRFRVSGAEKLPKKEPYLILANHSSMLDSFLLGTYLPRRITSMTSTSVFRVPFVGAYLKMIGCFPKMKYTKDRRSMEILQQNFDAGFPILIFPEGNRSWDGRMGPISPAIGRLIKRMKCKVMYINLNTASFHQPRWATYPRWVPIEVNYDGPYEYSEEQSIEEIWKDVVEKTAVIPKLKRPAKTIGIRMAHGLPEYLWACPACFGLEALKVSKKNGNIVACNHCSEEWELDVFNQMKGNNETMTVREAFDKVTAYFGDKPIADTEQFSERTIALECQGSQLFTFNSETNKMVEHALGSFVITPEGFEVQHQGEVLWRVDFPDLAAISVEMANLLHFRVDGALYRMVTPNQSPLKWAYFLRSWKKSLEVSM